MRASLLFQMYACIQYSHWLTHPDSKTGLWMCNIELLIYILCSSWTFLLWTRYWLTARYFFSWERFFNRLYFSSPGSTFTLIPEIREVCYLCLVSSTFMLLCWSRKQLFATAFQTIGCLSCELEDIYMKFNSPQIRTLPQLGEFWSCEQQH